MDFVTAAVIFAAARLLTFDKKKFAPSQRGELHRIDAMATRQKTKTDRDSHQAWPNTVAAKIVAGYIHLKYDVSASDLMFFNPPMGAMPFFNNSASTQIRRAELALVAGRILRHLADLGVLLEPGNTHAKAHDKLLEAMEGENQPSSGMVAAVDDHYRFADEA
jgi:hypothetical protein